MLIAQLLASPFHGGPERQVLGLAQHLPESHQTVFLSLAEGGRARDFLRRTSAAGFESIELKHNWPHLIRVVRELEHELRSRKSRHPLYQWLQARHLGLACGKTDRHPGCRDCTRLDGSQRAREGL